MIKQLSESKSFFLELAQVALQLQGAFHQAIFITGALPGVQDCLDPQLDFCFFSLQSFTCFTRSKLSLSQSKTGELCKELQPLNDQGSLC